MGLPRRQKVLIRNSAVFPWDGGSRFVTVLLATTPGIGRVHAVYIEALMRKGETEEVLDTLKEAGVGSLKLVKAKQRFINADCFYDFSAQVFR